MGKVLGSALVALLAATVTGLFFNDGFWWLFWISFVVAVLF